MRILVQSGGSMYIYITSVGAQLSAPSSKRRYVNRED